MVKLVKQLHQKKYRNELKLFIAEGEKIISELLTSSYTIHSLYATAEWLTNAELKNIGFPVFQVNERELMEISLHDTPNQVMALVHQPEIASTVSFQNDRNYLVLDAIRDPGNLGTILRIADWFGFDHLIGSADCVELFNPKVVQSSMGSIFRVAYTQGALVDLLSSEQEANKPKIYGAVLEGNSIFKERFGKGAILVIGNESNGISTSTRALIDQAIAIPSFNTSNNKPESLNAAIAAAICCAEVRRQQMA